MGDSDLSEFEMDEPIIGENLPSQACSVANENVFPRSQYHSGGSLRDAMQNFSQRTQRATAISNDLGDEVRPQNDFEKMLHAYKCSLRCDYSENYFICLEEGTFSELIHRLNKTLDTLEPLKRLMEAFKAAIGIRIKLQLYLSPCISPKGPQESIFRALLSCNHSQLKAFDLLIQKMEDLATEEDDNSIKLAMACVAQIRFLERIVDSSAMYQSIFDRDVSKWCPAVRDYFIEALPEVLTDVGCQQDAAIELRDMVLRRSVKKPLLFQTAVLGTLKLLRMNGSTAKIIRQDLCRDIMQLESPVLPDLCSFLLQTLNFDDKSTLRHILEDLSSHLKLAALKVEKSVSRIGVDEIIVEMFTKICRFAQLEGFRGWKEVSAFLRKGGPEGTDIDQTVLEGQEDAQAAGREFNFFEVILCLTVISTEGSPTSFIQLFKNQVTANPDKFEGLKDNINFVLKFKKFSTRFLQPLTHLAQQFLWTSDEQLQELGTLIYKNLFVTVQGCRQNVIKSMLSHLSSSSEEAQAILTGLEILVKNNFDIFEPFAVDMKDCLEHMEILSFSNIKRLFIILIIIYKSSPEMEKIKIAVEECTTKFLTSVNEKELIWGTLGILMQLQYELDSSASDRETKIRQSLETLSKKCHSPRLRSVMYTELSSMLQQNKDIKKSDALLKWIDELFQSFKENFFMARPTNYEPVGDLEGPRFVDEKHRRWLDTNSPRLIELVPLFKLLCGAIVLRQKWDDDAIESPQKQLKEIFFAFQANIAIEIDMDPGNATEKTLKAADTLYFVIEWCRELLNTFSNCKAVEGIEQNEIDSIWVRKFRLLFECQEKLQMAVKIAREWSFPIISTKYDRVTIFAEKDVGKKRPRKEEAKKKKGNKKIKREVETEEETEAGEAAEPVEKEHCSPMKKPLIFAEKCEKVPLNDLRTRLCPFKLTTVTRTLQYLPAKKRYTQFLLEEFVKILRVVTVKKVAKVAFWAAPKVVQKMDPKFHGEPSAVWNLISKGLCTAWECLNKVACSLRVDLNDSNCVDRPIALVKYLSDLFKVSLQAFIIVLSCDDINESSTNVEKLKDSRNKKRRTLMDRLEKVIIQGSSTDSQLIGSADEAETTVLDYFISLAELVPNIEVAVALVQAISACVVWNDEQRRNMGRITLNYLKKEWFDPEGVTLKGGPLNAPVRIILEKHISFRPPEHQLSDILWLLANKITELVPDETRRKSKLSSYADIDDPDLTEEDKGALFFCFNKSTFGAVYKVLFTSLCNIVQKQLAPKELLVANASRLQDIMKGWKVAGSVFSILCLMLRVRELRSSTLLTTAVKEGKRFLTILMKNSSYTHILDDSASLSSVTAEVTDVIRSVQVGNRTLQNISVYAKTHRSVSLLRAIPELRASHELLIRVIHSAAVRVGAQGAFEIGLLNSRDLNGAVIGQAVEIEEEAAGEEDSADEEGTTRTAESTVEETDSDSEEEHSSTVY